jgi:hypothetical protein
MARQSHTQIKRPSLTFQVSSSGGGLPGCPGFERIQGIRYFALHFSSNQRLLSVSHLIFQCRLKVAANNPHLNINGPHDLPD